MKLDILAFGAHPDDVELSCSGTLLKHIAEGKKAGVVDLTRGELGTRGSAAIRDEEAALAARLMGLQARENLEMQDGFFQHDKESVLKVISIIRKYQPEIVLANAIEDRHPDHGRAAKLIVESCFYAGLQKVETIDNGKPQAPWRPRNIYHYIQDKYIAPDFVIDITSHMEMKMDAVKAYKTQFYSPEQTTLEPSTPISTKDFLDFLYARAAEMGRMINAKYGEGFTVVRAPGIKSLLDIY